MPPNDKNDLLWARLQSTEEIIFRCSNAPISRHNSASLQSSVYATLETLILQQTPEPGAPQTLAVLIDKASASEHRRDIAMFLIRCLAVRGALHDDEGVGNQLLRKLVTLVEQSVPDVAKYFHMKEKQQTIDKINTLRGVHLKCIELLNPLKNLPKTPADFGAKRQEIFKLINNNFLKSYLNVYKFPEIQADIRAIMNGIYDILETKDASFAEKLGSTTELISTSIEAMSFRSDFIARDTYIPFLAASQEVVLRIERESLDRFKCMLKLRRSGNSVALERRYRLHERDRIINIKVPIVNDGPGIAIDTEAVILSGNDNFVISDNPIQIGAVPPGEFAIAVEALVGEPLKEADILIDLSWRTARAVDKQREAIDVKLLAQKPDVDWDALENLDPYSTEVAEGHEFVGRRAKVLALANRVLKPRMQSSYITGQKRVGKTSLALAVKDYVSSHTSTEFTTKIVYLEFGDYARRDADATIQSLGFAIARQLVHYLPFAAAVKPEDFEGSLAPLNGIAQHLFDVKPSHRFLIILDEFDEIHPDMYRFGALAEVFFSNLRTLCAKKNIAMMLVGGENMPFIMSAQGDQLNKFVREPLDYFSRSAEWDDFTNIVRSKNELPLNWHSTALTEMYNYTNGHPYYTKLLCAQICKNAVADLDTEVTVDEVTRAAGDLIDMLDTNAFAHFWKDGIPAGREQTEVIELNRCRVLVSYARSLRNGQQTQMDVIVSNKEAPNLANSDVQPILNDFCRRDILKEKDGCYQVVLPLFEHWLVARGMSKIIADTLGDEMASALQAVEDSAYVTSPEINLLVGGWPPYRGRSVTGEDVRSWLSQVPTFSEQRLLFRMLQNIRFVSHEEMQHKFRGAHSVVKRYTTPFTPGSRSQRRYDIMVTYVDGLAKSGARCAAQYAEANLISSRCVVPPEQFAQRLHEHEEQRNVTVNGVVVVDDVAATGRSLSKNIERFVLTNEKVLKDRTITVVVIALIATHDADELLRNTLDRVKDVDIDFNACEILESRHFAVRRDNGIWGDANEASRVRTIVETIGGKIYKDHPLGYGDMGLLLVFADTCPNNSLPILHSTGSSTWRPLFSRPVH